MILSISLRNEFRSLPLNSRLIPRGSPRHEVRFNDLRSGQPSKSDLQQENTNSSNYAFRFSNKNMSNTYIAQRLS